MQATKFAIVGAGDIARYHLEAIVKHPFAKLTAVMSSDKQKAYRLIEGISATVFDNYDELLECGDFDVICICTPSGTHSEFVVAAANKGKHILCEKPLDVTISHMDRMIEACKLNQVKLGCVFQRRLMPALSLVKQAIAAGKLGKLIMGNAYLKYYRNPVYYSSSSWKGTKELDGGGALMNQGVHGVDILLQLMGDVEAVTAYTATLTHNIQVEDTAAAVLKFKNGALGTIQGATSIYPGQETRFEIHGDRGSIEFSDQGFLQWKFADKTEETPVVEDLLGLAATSQSTQISTAGHEFYIADMIDAIQNDRDPIVNGEEARKSVELILAIYESSQKEQSIKL